MKVRVKVFKGGIMPIESAVKSGIYTLYARKIQRIGNFYKVYLGVCLDVRDCFFRRLMRKYLPFLVNRRPHMMFEPLTRNYTSGWSMVQDGTVQPFGNEMFIVFHPFGGKEEKVFPYEVDKPICRVAFLDRPAEIQLRRVKFISDFALGEL